MSVPICARIDPLDGIGPHFSRGRSGNHACRAHPTLPESFPSYQHCAPTWMNLVLPHPQTLLGYPQQGAASYRHAVKQLLQSVVREIRTLRSVRAGAGRSPPATRWATNDGRPYRDSIDGPVQRTPGYRQLTLESQIVRHSSCIKAVIHGWHSIVLARSNAASLH